MEVIDTWDGRTACALQAALRMTNESFAEHLGVAVRTVAAWHADRGIVPRPEIQQALDTTYERAGEAARRRFGRLAQPATGAAQPQALRVAIAVVLRGGEVLLVCRRGDAITWQFPAGVVKPGAVPDVVATQETHAETGVHATIVRQLGSRLHPVTGVIAEYYLCDYLAGEASNLDQIENMDVTWAPVGAITRFIPTDRIYPPVLAALKEIA